MKKIIPSSANTSAHQPGAFTTALRPIVIAVMASLASTTMAQDIDNAEPDTHTVVVTGSTNYSGPVNTPATIETVTVKELSDTTNVMNIEDALKYFPSVMVRKRFNGDTNEPVTSRTTGVNASARTLIFADGVLLSTLVNNNNGNGSPQWFMVSPEEIDSIDVMYGPFSAAYAGNSYGAVIQLNTRMTKQFEATVKVNVSKQNFDLYNTRKSYKSGDLNATIGKVRSLGLSAQTILIVSVSQSRLVRSHNQPKQQQVPYLSSLVRSQISTVLAVLLR